MASLVMALAALALAALAVFNVFRATNSRLWSQEEIDEYAEEVRRRHGIKG